MDILFFNLRIEKFLLSLEKSTQSKVGKQIKMLQEFGNILGMPYSKQIGRRLYELRIRGNQEVRILYTFYSNRAYIVHAFVKKTQKTPAKEIWLALERIKLLTSI